MAVGAGTLSGGTLVLALAKVMFARLLTQFDVVVAKVGQLDVAQAQTQARVEAVDERTSRNSEDVARMGARLDAVQGRVEGISSSYGPRLAALETAASLRAQT
jgi:hypothetical protein